MKPSPPLPESSLRTFEAILGHPAPRSLAWHDVYALLGQLGQVTEQTNGHLKATRLGHTLILHPPHSKEITDMSTLAGLRHFLEESEKSALSIDLMHWLVVIDHHEARVYRSEMQGAVPQRIIPHAPQGDTAHPRNTLEFSRSRERPDPASFFATVTTALGADGKILVFGSSKGKSSEMEQFLAWVKQHHPALAARIIGSVVVDEHHTTPAQLLAKAREFYATVAPSLLR